MLFLRVDLEDLPFVLVLINMADHDHIEGVLSNSNEAVLLDRSRQHPIALVVNVLSDDVDPSWRPGNELRLFVISMLEGADELVVPCPVIGGI